MGSLKKKRKAKIAKHKRRGACAKIVIRSVCATSRKGYAFEHEREGTKRGCRSQNSADSPSFGGCRLCLADLAALGAVADVLPTDAAQTSRALDSKGQRKADALAWFVNGLFEEESDGPEKALESYRRVSLWIRQYRSGYQGGL